MSEQNELIEILDGNAKAVAKAVTEGAFSMEQLSALNEAESQGQKRQPVLAALAKAMDTLVNTTPVDDSAANQQADKDDADQAEKPAATAKKQGDKEKRGELPEWKKPDYTGPLSCEQAVWRNDNLKVTTK